MEEKTTYYEVLNNKLKNEFWDNLDYRDGNAESIVFLMEVVSDLLYELDEKEREGK